MEKQVLIAVIGVSCCVLFRSVKPEYAFVTAVVTGSLLLLPAAADAAHLTDTIQAIADRFGVMETYGKALFKIIATVYLTHFGASLCRDHGLSAQAGNLELGGRICILTYTLPAMVTLLETGISLLNGAMR